MENAEQLLIEGYGYENWRPKFGPQLLVGLAHLRVVKDHSP